MHIAFISFEAPPDTLYGGIGTYIGQAASALATCGHEVEVFTATAGPSRMLQQNGYATHLLHGELTFEGRLNFSALAGTAFQQRHHEAPFDVLEGPEYLAEAAGAKALVPGIPLVAKLHMSMTMIRKINRPAMSRWEQWKDAGKARLQPYLGLHRWKEYDYPALEKPFLLMADEIVAPCREIADLTAQMWQLDRRSIVEIPYPFVPAPEMLEIPVDTTTGTVGYIGRLEQRKGVLDLAQAIPLILKHFPSTRFVLAGATQKSPLSGVSMQDYLTEKLAPYRESVSFLGRVPPEKLPAVFSAMDVCVLPSLWENFPNACLEAMAAGRGVVGSRAGGMAQQLADGEVGLLVDPQAPAQIAEQVCRLLKDPELRMELGAKARSRILSEYNARRIGRLMTESYGRAIIKSCRSRTGPI